MLFPVFSIKVDQLLILFLGFNIYKKVEVYSQFSLWQQSRKNKVSCAVIKIETTYVHITYNMYMHEHIYENMHFVGHHLGYLAFSRFNTDATVCIHSFDIKLYGDL